MRLRALWFVSRILHLIAFNSKLDSYLRNMRSQLEQPGQNRLLRTHFYLHLGKIYVDNHLYAEAEEVLELARIHVDEFLNPDGRSMTEFMFPCGLIKERTKLRDAYYDMRNNLLLHLAMVYRESRRFDDALALIDDVLHTLDVGQYFVGFNR